MKWYETRNSKPTLKHDQLIVAKNKKEDIIFILLPQIKKGDYTVIGYNWFDIENGKYNSSICWDNIDDAIEPYMRIYKLYNISYEKLADFFTL